MTVEIVAAKSADSRPIWFIGKNKTEQTALTSDVQAWAKANDFNGESGRILVLPGKDGTIAGALFGTGDDDQGGQSQLLAGKLARGLPEGDWHIENKPDHAELVTLAFLMGGYSFTRYRKGSDKTIRLAVPAGVNAAETQHIADAVTLARDLINTPTNDMGPDALEQAARDLASRNGAKVSTIEGDALLKQNFPMIHAVGRAGSIAPRLIDLTWRKHSDPQITLVGKGVCFDTGGLDIKPATGMLPMNQAMGRAAHVLGLAYTLTNAKLTDLLPLPIPTV